MSTTCHTKALLDKDGNSVTAEVYWDDRDPANEGFAYRIRWDGSGREESGPCDTANPWTAIYEFLGPDGAFDDGTPFAD
jgi:hypothetical protein